MRRLCIRCLRAGIRLRAIQIGFALRVAFRPDCVLVAIANGDTAGI